MNNERVKMPTLDKNLRITNFKEVERGFSEEEALKEASRCLQCNNPRCVKGCPVGVMIPLFIKEILNNDLNKAYEAILESSSLPSICGRVCPQEKQCEKMCIRGLKGESIAIGALERYVGDNNTYVDQKTIIKNGLKVAIVGSGPSGLACAYDLAKNGFEVTIYEVLQTPGGVLTYGIPEFRLPKDVVVREIDKLKKMGVNIITDVLIGNTLTLNDLQKEYDYVYLGTGAGIPKFMGIEGESANGVFSANEILTRVNLMKSYKNDANTPVKKASIAYVIGGGNVAMDAARSLRRLGIEVHLMYRRSMDELPARKMEVNHAIEEGIIFDTLKLPKKILVDEDNNVTGMQIVDMILGEKDDSGRRSVQEDPHSLQQITCDMVVMALGTSINHEAIKNTDIKTTDRGLIATNDSKTSIDNVYAGGDVVTGAATVILAMEAGKKAASEIINKNV
ncbi:MAG: NADPH-dependent glutamate synthase [Bacilli bacterium]|nr:NADPH-dependent glutamate synthase [Bacilli bacterium]